MNQKILDQIRQKFLEAGWYPERNVEQDAKKEWQERASLLEGEGVEVEPFLNAVSFLSSYTGIEVELWNDGERSALFSTRWQGEYINNIVDLSKKQKQPLFPIGMEISNLKVPNFAYDYMIICMDSESRFFGFWLEDFFFLGSNEWEAFENLMDQEFISDSKKVIVSSILEKVQKQSLEKLHNKISNKKENTLDQIKENLKKAGWFLGRDCKQKARKQLQQTILDAKSQGLSLKSFSQAEKFLRSYDGIKLELWHYEEWSSDLSIGGIFGNTVEEMVLQSEMLRLSLFPVGLQVTRLNQSLYEIMIICIDSHARFYGVHWSGFYFIGSNEWETFQNLMDQNFIEI